LLALKFGICAQVGLAISALRTFEVSYTGMQTVDISSDRTLALIFHLICTADGATYSFVTPVLALSLWYKHLSGGFRRLLQVPHTGVTPSHLIFRTLHASQARATLRRRRASFCCTSTFSICRAGRRAEGLSLKGSQWQNRHCLDFDLGKTG
jgi:hypothetical protein